MMLDLKKVFVLGTLGFIVICLGLFYLLTSSVNSRILSQNEKKLEFIQLEDKLKSIEEAVKSHRKSLNDIEKLVDGIPEDGHKKLKLGNLEHDVDSVKECSAAVGLGLVAQSNVNMLNVYDVLKFDNPNGGVWKQGWDVEIDSSRFTAEDKLKVFVIPHSHNDPGWIKTFERYFEDQTKHILNSMLDKLGKNEEVKFIWAEISYFHLWWETLDTKAKEQIIRFTKNGQLEFVTGGWVMPDEASSHYFSMISQLIEGHQWLYHHLGYVPRNGWSIDPFGMSPTNAYLIKRSGLKNMLIQRTHYAVKKELAKSKQLEFKWRQAWDNEGTSDILCHMMPFYSYDVPHTCGPDPKICCQFDFKRMRDVSHLSCPWGIQPYPINTKNMRERSTTLLDQYRKKAMLYKTNTLLVPLGDDFRWEDSKEWDAQTINYGKIMDFVNSQPNLNAEIKFGTLEDYFSSLNEEIKSGKFNPSALTGDFFTYADRDDHYWSGYFTSRPFHKSIDRLLMGQLRAAHIVYTLMSAELYKKEENENVLKLPFVRDIMGHLIRSRRTLSLFQHHDGIAGTSKDHVMVDYANKLLTALKSCDQVIQQGFQVLTHLNDPKFDLSKMAPDIAFFDAGKTMDSIDALPRLHLIILDQTMNQRLVVVFNSVGRRKTELVKLYVSTYNVKVYNRMGVLVESEVLPVFGDKTTVSRNVFELSFVAELGPLNLANYLLKLEKNDERSRPEISVLNSFSEILSHSEFPIKILQDVENELEISNEHLNVRFGKNGFMTSVFVNGKSYPLRVSMNHYGARHKKDTSGLYLFLPDGPARQIDPAKWFVRILKGKFQEYVEIWLDQVKHRVTVYKHPGYEQHSIEVKNMVDIRHEQNFELMMKFETNVESGNLFYTDLNGFQMIKRKRFSKIPIQGNYYPVPTAAYIEDPNLRFTIVSEQPLGGSSLASGEFEIVMDRRLMQDDERGAGQGGTDNQETESTFKLLFEVPQCEDKKKDEAPPMLSLQAHLTLDDLLHPFQTFIGQPDFSDAILSSMSDYIPKSIRSLPCDIQLTDLSPLPSYENSLDDHSFVPNPTTGLLVRRVGFNGQFLGGIPLPSCVTEGGHFGQFKPSDLFGDLIQSEIEQRTLTFIHDGTRILSNESILMKPMEIYGFLAQFPQPLNKVKQMEPEHGIET